MTQDSIIIYQTPDGQTSIDVTLENETLWLTQAQIVDLFQGSKANISEHITNIYSAGELAEAATVRKFRTVRTEGKRQVSRELEYYNLDMIISIGYRVNSLRGTQFRIWANKILKDFLVKGYALDDKRLREQATQLAALKQAIAIMGDVLERKELTSDEASGLLKVIADYSYALNTLDKYDHRQLLIERTHKDDVYVITYEAALKTIGELKEKFGKNTLFGNEKDQSFQSSLAAVYQSFGGDDVYPSVEEKAAQLLYFVVKNHSFSDGNKRIAAFLFVWFLERNGLLYRDDGSTRLAANALVALTLIIAESKPGDKVLMTQLVVNLINGNN